MGAASQKPATTSLVQRGALILLRGYKRFISPLLPPACRFQPTCSEYAAEAVQIHGLPWGSWLALRRLLRCHPFHRGGFDPVPSPAEVTESKPGFPEHTEDDGKSHDTCAG